MKTNKRDLSDADGRSLHSDISIAQSQFSRAAGYMEFKLSIQDFGCGIAAEKLNGLFVNFGNLVEHKK